MLIDELRYNVACLKRQNDNLVLAVAVLAEKLRQIDHTLNLGELPKRLPIGVFDLVADSDEGQHPSSLNMTVNVEGTIVRVRFDNGFRKTDDHHR